MSLTRDAVPAQAPKKRKLEQYAEEGGDNDFYGSDEDSDEPGIEEFVKPRSSPDGSLGKGPRASAPRKQNGFRNNDSSAHDSQLRSSGGMGKSAMMTLQMNELLSEVRPNHEKQLAQLETTLHRLKQIIESLPDVAPMTVVEAESSLSKKHGVAIPFSQPRPSKDTKYTFEYLKPANVNVVGSVPLRLSVKGKNIVDMTVTMPHSLFQEKDYLNQRLFHKRAYYLARIAEGIRDAAKADFSLEYGLQDDIHHLPALMVNPAEKSAPQFAPSNFTIRVLVAIPETKFPVEKTLPTKNCLRSPASDSEEASLATPFYNSCVRLSASYTAYHSLFHKANLNCDAFRDVCLLGRIWLRQRGYDSPMSRGGFGGFEWSAVCALLLQAGGPNSSTGLSNKYNTLQLFKAVIQFFASKDLTEPLLLNASSLKLPRSQVPTLYDGRTGVNVLFKMKPWSYQMLRREARLTVKAMNARSFDNFDGTFIMKSNESLLKFDELFQIRIPTPKTHFDGREDSPDLTSIYELLCRGLGDRVELIHINTVGTETWPIGSHGPTKKHTKRSLDVGLLLNSANSSRLVDHGPSAEDEKGSKDFRDFWGEKAELRRFKDGSISESLIWSEESPVTQQIIEYILQLHLKLSKDDVTSIVSKFDDLQSDGALIQPSAAFKYMNDAYQALLTQLYQLEGMPLSIRSISPADPQLRNASLYCPLVSSLTKPADMLIQFEGSARWPDSLPAIQHTKIAFLVKLGDLLSASDPNITTRVGLENTSSASSGYLNTSFMDIIYPSPAPGQGLRPIAFRLRIHHERTLTLLEQALSPGNKSLLTSTTRDTLTSALATHKRTSLASPLHTTTFANLCTRFPALSPTTRLLKKWTSSHLLHNHLPAEILELLTAYVFLHPFPFSSPATSQTAFLRTLLLIARWDWAVEPMILDLSLSSTTTDSSNNLTPGQHTEIQTRFAAWRKLDPGMNNVVLFFATNIDPTGVVWTQGARPSKVVAARFTALAKASIQLLRSKGPGDMGDEDWASLFKSQVTDFDFLVYLKKRVVKGGGGRRGGGAKMANGNRSDKYKNITLNEEMDIDTLGFDPVQLFLEDLESVFGSNVLFFHDADGGKVIGGLWNPRALGKKPWRVRLGFSSVPVPAEEGEDENGEGMVMMNQSGILAEIAMIGKGLVDWIDVVKQLAK